MLRRDRGHQLITAPYGGHSSSAPKIAFGIPRDRAQRPQHRPLRRDPSAQFLLRDLGIEAVPAVRLMQKMSTAVAVEELPARPRIVEEPQVEVAIPRIRRQGPATPVSPQIDLEAVRPDPLHLAVSSVHNTLPLALRSGPPPPIRASTTRSRSLSGSRSGTPSSAQPQRLREVKRGESSTPHRYIAPILPQHTSRDQHSLHRTRGDALRGSGFAPLQGRAQASAPSPAQREPSARPGAVFWKPWRVSGPRARRGLECGGRRAGRAGQRAACGRSGQ
ncbi:hypothetical protein SAMN05216298_0321 [Glycomyces sambucus]|uniref:Uncharacterized protein n=1 Tax=Glycomyces sambucus TaxID=380244 RepID=A0A1G9CGD4_9ACTN|nr:hypothetical protein SAMN05216298_0321 [Glycomyces sambucus]